MASVMKWHYCDLCETVATMCDSCNNTSCNASGCDECNELFEITHRMIEDGTAPAKEGLPIRSRKWTMEVMIQICSLCQDYSNEVMNKTIDFVFASFTIQPTIEELKKIISDQAKVT